MQIKRVYIEITNSCNLSCSFCIQNERPIRRMSAEEFSHVIKEVRPFTSHVYLHVLGEPLSHPQLPLFLDICEQAGLYVHLTTNGTLLKQRLEELCHPALQQVNISLHSFPQHRQSGYLQEVRMSADRLAAHGIHVNLRLWSLWQQRLSVQSEELLQEVLSWYGQPKPLHPQRLQRVDLRPYIHLHFEEVFTWPSLSQPFVSAQGRCLGMKTMVAVLSDGTITPCCLDSKGECRLGNIFSDHLKDVLASKRCEQMRRGFSENKVVEELCRHCSYRLRFSKGGTYAGIHKE